MSESPGLVHLYTGEGKGKSSAAFGLAMRAWGQGMRVIVIQFNKATEHSGEVRAARQLGIELRQFGTGSFIIDRDPRPEEIRAAEDGLSFAWGCMRSAYELVVLDEICVAISLGLLRVERVVEAVVGRSPETEVVMTGRGAPRELYEISDYITEMRLVKHPFDQGVPARKGIEY